MESAEGINIIDVPDIAEHKQDKYRLGFLCLEGLETFIKPIAEHFSDKYDVRTYYGNNLNEAVSIIAWCDLVFLEWGNQLAIELSQKVPQLATKKTILRVHSYEVLSGFIPHINWKVIDKTIFVAKHVKDLACKIFPKLPFLTDIKVIHNGV